MSDIAFNTLTGLITILIVPALVVSGYKLFRAVNKLNSEVEQLRKELLLEKSKKEKN